MASRHLPPLQTLRAFEAAVRLRSFTRAADELALTQGAVSQHIRRLESTLGTPLFVREHQGVAPTAHAQALALQARQGLTVLERAFSRADTGPRNAPGAAPPQRLVLSVLPAFAQRWLAPRVPRFLAAHPGIELDVRPSTALARLNGRDGIDLALRYGPGAWPGLESERLMDEEVFPVASPAYRRGRRLRAPRDLARCTLLRHTWQPWEPWFQAAGVDMVEPVHGPQFDDTDALLHAVMSGAGVALARRSLVAPDLAAGRLVRLWDIGIADVHAYYLVWRPGSAKLQAIGAVRRWLRREAAAAGTGA
ncbi:LysR substrate-binding domain-containing protein [Bordetella sp. BOR01]|uniref:LysR substrate-binding domain-containing protein n=1 Tax=Bordetella sp. BOR01 TaxID=2854779 RepID=UPI001C43D5B3|nr:LysR substrate-binding domain-containing protein [Bordetella sp. BOR01]MBV7481700.1 LysR family transcriptional regulator [Bordetella sp. BOR01]